MRKKPALSHVQIIALGFAAMIALGTALLMLPAASRSGEVGLNTAFFTAVSASCVTGLVLADTFTCWTGFGQAVILLLIQMGGLGFMTIATGFFLVLRRRMGLRGREVLSESINTTQVGGIMRLAKMIILTTLSLEAAGTLLLACRLCPKFGFRDGLWRSFFHSVSAFCNAGFDLMGSEGAYSSFTTMYGDALVNLTLCALITAGGLGFLVWEDISRHGLRFRRYSLHSRMVLVVSALLTFGGAVLFLLLERNATGGGRGAGERLLCALFSSVTARTAGFNTVELSEMTDASKLLTIALMFTGGSPGSTAGGVKTVTVAVIFIFAWNHMLGRRTVTAASRRLDDGLLRKAASVALLNLTLALTGTLFICAVQPLPLTDVLYECFSAVGTVGMSTGVTRELSLTSQLVVALLMYCGRVGSLSFATALASGKTPPPVSCPREDVIIG